MKTAATIGTVVIFALIGFSWVRGKILDGFSCDTIEHVDPPATLGQLVDPVKPAPKSSSWAVRALREAGGDE